MYDVDSTAESYREQERIVTTQQTAAHYYPPLSAYMLVVLLFQLPSLRNNLLLLFFSYCFFCCCSDETFFFWCWSCFLCSATAALHSAFCRRVFWGVEEKTRERGLGVVEGLLGQWFPTCGVWDESKGSHDDYINIWKKAFFLYTKFG